MAVRQLVRGADRTVADLLGLRAVAEEDVVLVDARDLDPAEETFLAASAVRRCPVDRVPVPDRPVYLHLDLDVVDPQDVPGLLFPAPGGPRLPAFTAAVRDVLAGGSVAAVGFACTWRPGSGADRILADLTREVAAPR